MMQRGDATIDPFQSATAPPVRAPGGVLRRVVHTETSQLGVSGSSSNNASTMPTLMSTALPAQPSFYNAPMPPPPPRTSKPAPQPQQATRLASPPPPPSDMHVGDDNQDDETQARIGGDRSGYNAQTGANNFVNWRFSGPMPTNLSLEAAATEELLRMTEMAQDAIYRFVVNVAGASGHVVKPADLWTGSAQGGGAVRAIIYNLQQLARSPIGGQDGATNDSFQQTARTEIHLALQRVRELQAARSGGATGTAAAATGASGVPSSALLSALQSSQAKPVAAPATAPAPAQPLLRAASAAQAASAPLPAPAAPAAAPQARPPLRGLAELPAEVVDNLDNRQMTLLWMMTLPNLNESQLRAWAMAFESDGHYFPPNSRPSSAAAGGSNDPDTRTKWIEHAMKIKRLFERGGDDASSWYKAPENVGTMFLTDDLTTSVSFCAGRVRHRSGLQQVHEVELMTHANVSMHFARLVAADLANNDTNGQHGRYATRHGAGRVSSRYARALAVFEGLYYVQTRDDKGGAHFELALREQFCTPYGGDTMRTFSPQAAYERERHGRDAIVYAQTNGRYFTGGATSNTFVMQSSARRLGGGGSGSLLWDARPRAEDTGLPPAPVYRRQLPELGGGLTTLSPDEQRAELQRYSERVGF